MDKEYNDHPNYGTRSIVNLLKERGFHVSRRGIRHLMVRMNIEAVYPKKNISKLGREKYVIPYPLKHKSIEWPNYV